MMLPNQITSQNFSQTGKGGYKSVEVDAFLQRVYQSYNKLYQDNKALCEKLDETIPLLDEYTKSKNSIADALIWAKATAEKNIEEAKVIADKLVAEATDKADRIYNEKVAEADSYYNGKVTQAKEDAAKAEAELESLKKQSEKYSEKYVEQINQKAQALVEEANLKAASIVADAYSDAKEAKEKTEKIIADANAELNSLKAEAAEIKKEIFALITHAQNAADKVRERIFEPVTVEENAEDVVPEADSIDFATLEKFSMDDFEEIAEPVEEEEVKTETNNSDPGYVRFFGAESPDVNDLLSGIFTAIRDEGAKKVKNDEDENSFRFADIFADPSDRRI